MPRIEVNLTEKERESIKALVRSHNLWLRGRRKGFGNIGHMNSRLDEFRKNLACHIASGEVTEDSLGFLSYKPKISDKFPE